MENYVGIWGLNGLSFCLVLRCFYDNYSIFLTQKLSKNVDTNFSLIIKPILRDPFVEFFIQPYYIIRTQKLKMCVGTEAI